MRDVKYSFASAEFLQNKDPLTNLKFSDEIKNYPQQFYSQRGDKITVEEFAKQFTLSVFCNYLALRSEGLENIQINIGGDGSLTMAEQPKSLVLHQPAVIKSKELQIELIRLLEQMISYYDKMLLKKEIVDEAKNNNRYYQKKAMIKDHLMTSD